MADVLISQFKNPLELRSKAPSRGGAPTAPPPKPAPAPKDTVSLSPAQPKGAGSADALLQNLGDAFTVRKEADKADQDSRRQAFDLVGQMMFPGQK